MLQIQKLVINTYFSYNRAMNTECKTIKEQLEERELEQLSPYATTMQKF